MKKKKKKKLAGNNMVPVISNYNSKKSSFTFMILSHLNKDDTVACGSLHTNCLSTLCHKSIIGGEENNYVFSGH